MEDSLLEKAKQIQFLSGVLVTSIEEGNMLYAGKTADWIVKEAISIEEKITEIENS